jgi:hypothetical protein
MLAGFVAGDGAEHPRERMTWFALDGLEWSVVLPLLGIGRMPTLTRPIAQGSYGPPSTVSELATARSVLDGPPTLLALPDLRHDTPEWRPERARRAAELPSGHDPERAQQ